MEEDSKEDDRRLEDGQRETILISDSLRGDACYMRVILI